MRDSTARVFTACVLSACVALTACAGEVTTEEDEQGAEPSELGSTTQALYDNAIRLYTEEGIDCAITPPYDCVRNADVWVGGNDDTWMDMELEYGADIAIQVLDPYADPNAAKFSLHIWRQPYNGRGDAPLEWVGPFTAMNGFKNVWLNETRGRARYLIKFPRALANPGVQWLRFNSIQCDGRAPSPGRCTTSLQPTETCNYSSACDKGLACLRWDQRAVGFFDQGQCSQSAAAAPLTAPSGVAAGGSASFSIDVSWNDTALPSDRYSISWRMEGEATQYVGDLVPTGSGQRYSYRFSGLGLFRTYQFQVCSSDGRRSLCADWVSARAKNPPINSICTTKPWLCP